MAALGVASRGVAMRPAARGLPRMTPVVRVAGGRNFNLKVRPMARRNDNGGQPKLQPLFLLPPPLSFFCPPVRRSCASGGRICRGIYARVGP